MSATPSTLAEIARNLHEHSEELVHRVTARFAIEIPAYLQLPAAVFASDFVTNIATVFTVFLDAAAQGRRPSEEKLRLPVEWGAERARDGLPLSAVLKTYPLGAREAWRFAQDLGLDTPPEFAELILDFLAEVMPRVAQSYLRERADIAWEHRERRRDLATALLSGLGEQTAARYGVQLADQYAVLAFDLPFPPPGTSDRANTDMLRALQNALDDYPAVLATFGGTGGVLLVPPSTATPDPAGCAAIVLAQLERVIGARCVGGLSIAQSIDRVPDAYTEANDLRILAERLQRKPGIYTMADLALEYQIGRPGPARTALAASLEPLRTKPHLLDALRALIAHDQQRTPAAHALSVHRNTLTYRLGRIRTITGLDATDPNHARRLAAAITAYDIESHDHEPTPRSHEQ